MNVHLGNEYGIPGWGRTYANGHAFTQTMNKYELKIIDIGEKGWAQQIPSIVAIVFHTLIIVSFLKISHI